MTVAELLGEIEAANPDNEAEVVVLVLSPIFKQAAIYSVYYNGEQLLLNTDAEYARDQV